MFTKDFTKPVPFRPMVPDSVRKTVRDAQDAGRRAEEKANMNMPFRARLKARDAVRPQSTLAIISGIQAKASTPPSPASRVTVPRVRAISSNPGAFPIGKNGKGAGPSGGGHDDNADSGSRLGEISQFAFAGLAVLGLAGLSVMAAESALNSKDADTGADEGRQANAGPVVPQGGASSIAMAAASTPVGTAPTQWFDYKSVADTLAANKAAFETAQREAASAEAEQARIQAANAIADAEAKRVADAAAEAADAETARLAAAELEKTRVANAEAALVAEREEQRLAELKVEEEAAAAAETKRLADLEARRLAQAEAETQRLAEIQAKKDAAAEARRVADAAAEQKRMVAAAAESQRQRLAAAAAAEETRLVALAVSAPTPSRPLATPTPTPRRPLQMVAYTGVIPAAATLKPARSGVVLASASAPVTRKVPSQSYTQASASVRAFSGEPVVVTPRSVDDFVAERVELTASEALDSDMLNVLRTDMLRLVDTQADGAAQILQTPDGRTLNILVERSLSREVSKPTVRTIDYTDATTDAAPLKVSILCRDIAYAFPGQERGRFAACQAPTGGWVMARASEVDGKPQA
jgi:hypothetical protein